MRGTDKQNDFHECCYYKMNCISFRSFSLSSLDIDTIVNIKKTLKIFFCGMWEWEYKNIEPLSMMS